MEEKTITLELNEPEVGVVWQTLMSGSVLGQHAPHVVTVAQKIQAALNEANTPEPVSTAEAETPLEEPKPEEAKSKEE